MSPASTLPMVIDCDPGVDDAIALLAAARLADVVGITTVTGNVDIDHATHNALAVVEIAGLDIPVHRGAPRPRRSEPVGARHVHGPTGLGSVVLPEISSTIASGDAVGFILETARSIDGLHLVAIGPLTNVAEALRRDPTLPSRLAGLTIMGGAMVGGNVTPTAEFNIWADAEAADIVFREWGPLTMVGLDVTHQVLFGDDAHERFRSGGTAAAGLAAGLLEHAIARSREIRGWPGAPIHDACAVLAATHPEHFDGTIHPVAIELTGTHTRGMTVVDRRAEASADAPRHRVLRDVDAMAVAEQIVSAVTALPSS